MNERTAYIYTLCETGSDDVRYVGQTINIESRLAGHMDISKMADTNPKRIWIEDVLSRGSTLVINIIEETTPQNAQFREQHWIDYYLSLGAELTNTRGGLENPSIFRGKRSKDGSLRFVPTRLDEKVIDMIKEDHPLFARNESSIIRFALQAYLEQSGPERIQEFREWREETEAK